MPSMLLRSGWTIAEENDSKTTGPSYPMVARARKNESKSTVPEPRISARSARRRTCRGWMPPGCSTLAKRWLLRGRYREVYAFANSLIAQSGVRHGNIHIVPVEMDAPGTRKHTHFHYQPRT